MGNEARQAALRLIELIPAGEPEERCGSLVKQWLSAHGRITPQAPSHDYLKSMAGEMGGYLQMRLKKLVSNMPPYMVRKQANFFSRPSPLSPRPGQRKRRFVPAFPLLMG